MITNEEKAKEISGICSFCLTTNTERCAPCTMLSSYTVSLRMARWKDEQFKEYVKSKFLQCENNTANVPLKAGLFDEIIKEILNVEP